jgi:hypothetical protein
MTALEQLIAAGGVTIPQRKLMELESMSVNMVVALYRAGEIDSVVVGDRLRRVIIASYLAYLRCRQLGLARDEGERQASIESYRRSLSSRGAAAAARARAGISRGARARGRRKAAAVREEPRTLFPQQKIRGRRQSSESKPPTTLKDSVTIT